MVLASALVLVLVLVLGLRNKSCLEPTKDLLLHTLQCRSKLQNKNNLVEGFQCTHQPLIVEHIVDM